uniref:rolling circle replication-associated protein n=1 Tax=Synechococcus sp. TaxID=1131 RepID=UPI000166005B|nr:hypothetical protein [Synechococcus sp.]
MMIARLYPDRFLSIGWRPSRFIETKDLSQGKKIHRPYGSNGLTPYSRRAIKSISALYGKRWGRDLGFYTLTCPFPDRERFEQFNALMPEIQRRFFQEMGRIYARRGHAFRYLAVLEFQERGALHLHFLAPARGRKRKQGGGYGAKDWIISAEEIRILWSRIICSLFGISYQRFPASIDAQQCRKDPGSYMSKYLSKGSGGGATISPPARWWSTDKQSLKAFKISIKRLPPEISAQIWQHPENFCSWFVWVEVRGDRDDEPKRIVALAGKLSQESFNFLYSEEKIQIATMLLGH